VPRRLTRTCVAIATCVVLGACSQSLQPYGNAVIVVDTDLPTPALASRLRIDVYAPDGTWADSRDIALPEAQSWPASFGMVAPTLARDSLVYVRLRIYPEGGTRDYLGERYAPPATFTPPFVPHSVSSMCDQPLALALGSTVTGRRGADPFFSLMSGGDCTAQGYANRQGSFAAAVDLPGPGTYTFGALATDPTSVYPFPDQNGYPPSPWTQVSLQVRTTCADDASYLACDIGYQTGDGLPRITTTFSKPGPQRVYLVVGGIDLASNPTDVTLGAWASTSKVPRPPSKTAPLPSPVPFWVNGDPTQTPTTEPAPEVTIDRLVLLHLVPGVQGSVEVAMRGACLGVMSKLGDGGIDLSGAQTCVDGADPLVSVVEQSVVPRAAAPPKLPATAFGTFAACTDTGDATRVCIPGGVFVMGGRNFVGYGSESSAPPHTAAVSTFVLDSHEVTVGDFHDAVSHGLKIEYADTAYVSPTLGCVWSSTDPTTPAPSTDPGVPMNCATWYAAEAYCKSRGGDLPTEAQWEYAARAAGRDVPTRFPWGDDAPSCACDGTVSPCHAPVFGRGSTCASLPVVLPNVHVSDGATGDVTPLGVVGMGGSVSEWTLDAAHAYDDDCWRAAGTLDPKCLEDQALQHSLRGGSYESTALMLDPTYRPAQSPRDLLNLLRIGFRCAYPLPSSSP
jgi:formylglycine-generating enzyme required for sulfatase activity